MASSPPPPLRRWSRPPSSPAFSTWYAPARAPPPPGPTTCPRASPRAASPCTAWLGATPDCAACLAAASRLIVARKGCAAASSAIWRDACFLRYSDRDDRPGGFREDEYTATVFNLASLGAPLLLFPSYDYGKAAVTRLLGTAGNRTMRSHMCRGAGGARATGATAAAGRLMIHGLTRCAAGISCPDCRRCLLLWTGMFVGGGWRRE